MIYIRSTSTTEQFWNTTVAKTLHVNYISKGLLYTHTRKKHPLLAIQAIISQITVTEVKQYMLYRFLLIQLG